eukprot:3748980-Rhodomonas_salina.1
MDAEHDVENPDVPFLDEIRNSEEMESAIVVAEPCEIVQAKKESKHSFHYLGEESRKSIQILRQKVRENSPFECLTSKGPKPVIETLKQNLRSAVMVCMVSIPLSIGIGISSGASPVVGLRAA